MILKNAGPAWRRPSGEVIPHAGLFIPTPVELDRMRQRRQIGIKFVEANPEPPPGLELPSLGRAAYAPELDSSAEGDPTGKDVGPSNRPEGEGSAGVVEEWPLRMAPTTYLKLHPEGQHAALARRLTEEAAE